MGIQRNQKELTKTFMMILNWKIENLNWIFHPHCHNALPSSASVLLFSSSQVLFHQPAHFFPIFSHYLQMKHRCKYTRGFYTAELFVNIFYYFSPFEPEFTIVIFILYKPRHVVDEDDLMWFKNCFMEIFILKLVVVGKLSLFSGM